jgi:uncharacterized membrane protein
MWTSPPDGGPERLIALADGVFAIAITLLVLDLSVPKRLDSAQYHEALRELLPDLGAYALSFMVLAAFWRGHRQLFRIVRQVDRQVITLSMAGLGLAALLPFPTRLLSDYGDEAVSVAIYAAAVASLGAAHLALLVVLARRPWLRGDETPAGGFRYQGLDLATTVVVFFLTLPLTAVMGSGAILWWLVLIPAKRILGRRARRAR